MCIFIFLLYLAFKVKKTVDRLDSILKNLDENLPHLMDEMRATLRSVRTFSEDLNPLKDELKGVLRAISKIASLLEVLIPDPSTLKELKDGLLTLLSSILSIFWPAKKR